MPTKKEVLDRLADQTPPETEMATIYGVPISEFYAPEELRVVALWALNRLDRDNRERLERLDRLTPRRPKKNWLLDRLGLG